MPPQGILAWSLILLGLPLGFCSKCQTTKEQIKADYSNIIFHRINRIIADTNVTCQDHNSNAPPNITIRHLRRVVCRHPREDFCHLKAQVEALRTEMEISLGCSCSKGRLRQLRQEGSCSHRKFCTLKRWLARMKDLYSQFNST